VTTTNDALRSGVSYWWRSYLMMSRWELTNLRLLLPVTVMVQILSGAGFVLGVGLFFDQIPDRAALFVSTGVVVINLVLVGMIMGPQLIAQQKFDQTYDFMWSLPIPRATAALAWVTTNMIIALPGMAVALAVAVWRYDLPIDISPSIAPAVLLVLVTGTMVGHAMAHVIGNPLIMQLITQVTIFVIIGFSPVNFPIDQLPGWLQAIHEWLPFHPMAVVTRAGLTVGVVDDVPRAYAVLAVWTVAATATTAWVLSRRK
jgi:ABC-2 type transport system permease protein